MSKTIIFCSIRSHIKMHGYNEADQEAEPDLQQPTINIEIPHSDFNSHIQIYTTDICQSKWNKILNNKLHEIKPSFSSRKGLEVFTRCRLGHSRLTHSFVLNNEEIPGSSHNLTHFIKLI